MDMELWGKWQRCRWGARSSIGLGFVAGGLEAAYLSTELRLPMGFLEFVALGLLCVLVMGAVGWLFGLLGGIPHLLKLDWYAPQPMSIQIGAAGFALCGFYLWQSAWRIGFDGRLVAAACMALMPFGFWGVVYFNARYWVRRLWAGTEYRVGWLPVSLGVALLLVLGSGWGYGSRYTGGAGALDDPSVVLITVDTLRRDHVGVYGGGKAETPHLDAFAEDAVVFLDAVTPMPETAPAHATILTGLHPLRHRVVSNGHRLSRGFKTVTEILEGEGFATAAFVSSFALDAERGLQQGFQIYDDDLTSSFPGLARNNVLGWLIRGWMVFGRPASTPWLLERDGQDTNNRFYSWLDSHQDMPFFAWIHYFEPHAPYAGSLDHAALLDGGEYSDAQRERLKAQYAGEVERADALIGDVLAQLEARGLAEHTLVIITSDHGEMLGEHGLDFHHHGLHEEVVRVPLLIRAPGLRPKTLRITPQVRLMDISPTILDYLRMDPFHEAEGADLMGYAEGVRERPMWSALLGRRSRSWSDGVLLGLRNHGVKYWEDLGTGEEQLFNVHRDPTESDDILDEQPEAAATARRLLGPEKVAAKKLIPVEAQPAGTGAMLEALGYQE